MPRALFPLLSSLLGSVMLTGAVTAARAQSCAQVDVSHVRPQRGQLMLAAYGDADSFNKAPLTALRLAAGDERMQFQVCGLTGHEVALMLFQDLDGNGRMDRNVLGMPTEPWGSSGTPGSFGPSWETGRVPLDGQPIVVRLSL